MDKKKRILYIVAGETGFINIDEKIIRSFADVRTTIIATIWDCFKLELLLNFWFADSILIWFASMHAIPAVLLNYFFNKPLFIIAGGWDVANVPEIKYGAMQGGSRTVIGQWLLSRAHKVIAVSKSNRKEIINNGKVHPSRIKLVYNAVSDIDQGDISERKDQVLTVGEINEETFLRKGLDSFIEVAHKLPEIPFIHIGKWTDKNGKPCTNMINYIIKKSPPNIRYLGFVDHEVLEKYYQELKVYLQLSRHEAFGISVVEAIRSGCVPIVSNCYALPEIIGDSGYIVEEYVGETVEIIKKILRPDYNRFKPDARLDFSIDKRKKNFMKLF